MSIKDRSDIAHCLSAIDATRAAFIAAAERGQSVGLTREVPIIEKRTVGGIKKRPHGQKLHIRIDGGPIPEGWAMPAEE